MLFEVYMLLDRVLIWKVGKTFYVSCQILFFSLLSVEKERESDDQKNIK